jgi:diguanylate cyclase (GGDEF)-like protein
MNPVDIIDHRGFFAAVAAAGEAVRAAFDTFALPVAVLAACVFLIAYTPELPVVLAPLRLYGPYLTFGVGLLISLAFKRGRALFAILTLLLAYDSFRLFLANEPQGFASRTVYAALCVFVPFNLALLSMVRERGALNVFGARWLALLAIEIGVTAAIVVGNYTTFTGALYRPFLDPAWLPGSPVPQLGLAAMALALTVAVARAVTSAGVIEAAFAVAVMAIGAACSAAGLTEAYAWFNAAGVMVAAGVLHDSHRMAFRDELTGLPGRRALMERLFGLDGHYAIAMLDVDHFKHFNDTWGHDVGDQALKLVASRLQRVSGGGTAYRYGGEEFVVVFPGMGPFAVLRYAEVLRKDIDDYEFEIRAHSRRRRRGSERAEATDIGVSRWASVCVSIGVAERTDRLAAPGAVLAAADEALFRAKKAGRNRVSR